MDSYKNIEVKKGEPCFSESLLPLMQLFQTPMLLLQYKSATQQELHKVTAAGNKK